MSLTVRQMIGNKKDKRLLGLVSVSPETSVYDALLKLEEYKIGILAVVRNSALLGLFGDRDNRKVTLKCRDPKETAIGEFMTPFSVVHWVTMDAEVEFCLEIMHQLGVNHLPVMEGEGEYARPIGMISRKDIDREIVDRKILRETALSTMNQAD